MMKEDWTDIMKRKLEGHRKTPPAGLWEDISKKMGLDAEPVRKPAASRRWWWAAAAVLVLAGFFAVQKGSDNGPSQQTKVVVPKPESQQHTEDNPVVQEPQSKEPLLAVVPHHNQTEKASVTSHLAAEVEETQPESPSETLQAPEEPQRNENSEVRSEDLEAETKRYDYQTDTDEKKESAQKNKWSVGLNASGGLLAASNNVRTDRLYYYKDYTNSTLVQPGSWMGDIGNYYTRTEFVSKHHLPVRFGLSVQYQLNPRLALHSGISYTRLYSEFTVPLYPAVHYDQRLHYLGISLGATWQLWSANRFRFYLSGGVMLEKCVSADLGQDTKLSRKPWQWSFDAAAGVEYSLTRQFGFYLEPSLGYYFDDGTSLEHYYKEHPLAPSIEFGLRLHL